jgi:hypothetical protein
LIRTLHLDAWEIRKARTGVKPGLAAPNTSGKGGAAIVVPVDESRMRQARSRADQALEM